MKIYKKILIMFLIIISSILATNQVFAKAESQIPDDIATYRVINPNYYNPSEDDKTITAGAKKSITSKIGGILGWIRNIAIIVATITLMLIGIGYMIGSASERAQYKETLIPWIIGCIISVTGTTLISFIYDVIT